MALLVLGLAGSRLSAQTPVRLPDPETKTLTTRDGGPLRITYYESGKGKESPVVILLHQKGGNRFVWQRGFAETLQKDGFAVVTVDLRFHGESRGTQPPGGSAAATNLKPADYVAMVALDLPAVKRFLVEEHHAEKLNINKLGIVGADISAAVAVYFAQYDWAQLPYEDNSDFSLRTPRGQDVKALVLISPDGKVPGLPISTPINKPLKDYPDLAFFVCSGTKSAEKSEVSEIYGILTKAKDSEKRMYREEFKANLSGTELLGKVSLEGKMLTFFRAHLKNAPGSWRNRRSPLYDDPDEGK